MDPGELKPILGALALPPTATLLLALVGLLMARKTRAFGLWIAGFWIVVTLAFSTNGMALVLMRLLSPPVQAVQLQDLRQVQAIVVLGGGVVPSAPEYGAPQPSEASLGRLRYGARLARLTGKPLAFAGGIGWSALGQAEPEAEVARRVLKEDYALGVRWLDDQSRDTAENATRIGELVQRDNVRRIALVTDAIHMPRAAALFRRAGFEVVAAPTDFPAPRDRLLLEWLPSSRGIATCRYILREWLGRLVARVV